MSIEIFVPAMYRVQQAMMSKQVQNTVKANEIRCDKQLQLQFRVPPDYPYSASNRGIVPAIVRLS